MSIRTTNVYVLIAMFNSCRINLTRCSYEERSLGVFEPPPDDEDEEPADLNQIKSGKERVGRYIGWHLRRQLSIGVLPLRDTL